MKLGITSDIHLEFYNTLEEKMYVLRSILDWECDAFILPGDLATLRGGLKEALEFLLEDGRPIVYTVGNHEYYGRHPHDQIHKCLLDLSNRHAHFHWLHNEYLHLDSIRFAGGPLWFAFSKFDPLRYNINDFNQIVDADEFIARENFDTINFFRRLFETDKVDVMISHHLPSEHCVSPQFKGSNLNKFFVCPVLDKLFLNQGPKYWIHGHTHDKVDVVVRGTRVLANPLGYPHEITQPYQPLIIDVQPSE